MSELYTTAEIGGRPVVMAQLGQLQIAFDGQHFYLALKCKLTTWSFGGAALAAKNGLLSGAALRASTLAASRRQMR